MPSEAASKARSVRAIQPTPFSRVALIVIAIASVMLIDLGLCRLHYHGHLMNIRFMRHEAQRHIEDGVCPESVDAKPGNAEKIACSESACKWWAVELGRSRQAAIEFVRSVHPAGRWAAMNFDNSRGVDQTDKLIKLQADKNCTALIDSAVRSNSRADFGSALAFLLGIAGIVGVYGFW